MATDLVDDQEMREAQRDYLDFLDDDVSLNFIRLNAPLSGEIRKLVAATKTISFIDKCNRTLGNFVQQFGVFYLIVL